MAYRSVLGAYSKPRALVSVKTARAVDFYHTVTGSTTVLDYGDANLDTSDPKQLINVSNNPQAYLGLSEFAVTLTYDTSDDNNQSQGIAFRIHFDSSKLSLLSVENHVNHGYVQTETAVLDTDDLDNDAVTDKYVMLRWVRTNNLWPGTNEALPLQLATVKFSVSDDIAARGNTTLNFSPVETSYGYIFRAESVPIDIAYVSFDIDKDGRLDALTDGLLFLRYLFGGGTTTGEGLTQGAISAQASLTPQEVEENVKTVTEVIGDIDGSGNVDALTDGLLLLRYAFGIRGDALANSAVALNATRTTGADIENYIENFLPRIFSDPVPAPEEAENVQRADTRSVLSVTIPKAISTAISLKALNNAVTPRLVDPVLSDISRKIQAENSFVDLNAIASYVNIVPITNYPKIKAQVSDSVFYEEVISNSFNVTDVSSIVLLKELLSTTSITDADPHFAVAKAQASDFSIGEEAFLTIAFNREFSGVDEQFSITDSPPIVSKSGPIFDEHITSENIDLLFYNVIDKESGFGFGEDVVNISMAYGIFDTDDTFSVAEEFILDYKPVTVDEQTIFEALTTSVFYMETFTDALELKDFFSTDKHSDLSQSGEDESFGFVDKHSFQAIFNRVFTGSDESLSVADAPSLLSAKPFADSYRPKEVIYNDFYYNENVDENISIEDVFSFTPTTAYADTFGVSEILAASVGKTFTDVNNVEEFLSTSIFYEEKFSDGLTARDFFKLGQEISSRIDELGTKDEQNFQSVVYRTFGADDDLQVAKITDAPALDFSTSIDNAEDTQTVQEVITFKPFYIEAITEALSIADEVTPSVGKGFNSFSSVKDVSSFKVAQKFKDEQETAETIQLSNYYNVTASSGLTLLDEINNGDLVKGRENFFGMGDQETLVVQFERVFDSADDLATILDLPSLTYQPLHTDSLEASQENVTQNIYFEEVISNSFSFDEEIKPSSLKGAQSFFEIKQQTVFSNEKITTDFVPSKEAFFFSNSFLENFEDSFALQSSADFGRGIGKVRGNPLGISDEQTFQVNYFRNFVGSDNLEKVPNVFAAYDQTVAFSGTGTKRVSIRNVAYYEIASNSNQELSFIKQTIPTTPGSVYVFSIITLSRSSTTNSLALSARDGLDNSLLSTSANTWTERNGQTLSIEFVATTNTTTLIVRGFFEQNGGVSKIREVNLHERVGFGFGFVDKDSFAVDKPINDPTNDVTTSVESIFNLSYLDQAEVETLGLIEIPPVITSVKNVGELSFGLGSEPSLNTTSSLTDDQPVDEAVSSFFAYNEFFTDGFRLDSNANAGNVIKDKENIFGIKDEHAFQIVYQRVFDNADVENFATFDVPSLLSSKPFSDSFSSSENLKFLSYVDLVISAFDRIHTLGLTDEFDLTPVKSFTSGQFFEISDALSVRPALLLSDNYTPTENIDLAIAYAENASSVFGLTDVLSFGHVISGIENFANMDDSQFSRSAFYLRSFNNATEEKVDLLETVGLLPLKNLTDTQSSIEQLAVFSHYQETIASAITLQDSADLVPSTAFSVQPSSPELTMLDEHSFETVYNRDLPTLDIDVDDVLKLQPLKNLTNSLGVDDAPPSLQVNFNRLITETIDIADESSLQFSDNNSISTSKAFELLDEHSFETVYNRNLRTLNIGTHSDVAKLQLLKSLTDSQSLQEHTNNAFYYVEIVTDSVTMLDASVEGLSSAHIKNAPPSDFGVSDEETLSVIYNRSFDDANQEKATLLEDSIVNFTKSLADQQATEELVTSFNFYSEPFNDSLDLGDAFTLSVVSNFFVTPESEKITLRDSFDLTKSLTITPQFFTAVPDIFTEGDPTVLFTTELTRPVDGFPFYELRGSGGTRGGVEQTVATDIGKTYRFTVPVIYRFSPNDVLDLSAVSSTGAIISASTESQSFRRTDAVLEFVATTSTTTLKALGPPALSVMYIGPITLEKEGETASLSEVASLNAVKSLSDSYSSAENIKFSNYFNHNVSSNLSVLDTDEDFDLQATIAAIENPIENQINQNQNEVNQIIQLIEIIFGIGSAIDSSWQSGTNEQYREALRVSRVLNNGLGITLFEQYVFATQQKTDRTITHQKGTGSSTQSNPFNTPFGISEISTLTPTKGLNNNFSFVDEDAVLTVSYNRVFAEGFSLDEAVDIPTSPSLGKGNVFGLSDSADFYVNTTRAEDETLSVIESLNLAPNKSITENIAANETFAFSFSSNPTELIGVTEVAIKANSKIINNTTNVTENIILSLTKGLTDTQSTSDNDGTVVYSQVKSDSFGITESVSTTLTRTEGPVNYSAINSIPLN